VTTAAAQCGLSAQAPGASVSARVAGLPPLAISVAPVVLPTIPVTLPAVPGLPGASSPAGPSPTPAGTGVGYTAPGTQVPAEVVPRGGGPDLSGQRTAGAGGSNAKNTGLTETGPLASSGTPNLPGGKSVDLSAKKRPAAQVPVVLAISAIVALSLVSALYARRYLLSRG
jgi:hypothetical protein